MEPKKPYSKKRVKRISAALMAYLTFQREYSDKQPEGKYAMAIKALDKGIEAMLYADVMRSIKDKDGKQLELSNMRSNFLSFAKRFKTIKAGLKTSNGLKPEWIEMAKQVPITQILESRGFRVIRSTSLCPFHQEKTGSFHVYEKDNRYKCFGCGERGDSIDLYKHFTGYNFQQSVMALKGF